MKLKYITFFLENCDSITIDGKYIGSFLVSDIKTSIQRIACNAINRIDTANTFAIEIHRDANKERYQFDQTDYEDWKQMTFDRLNQYHDITSIEFELEEDNIEDGEIPCREHYEYYVDWTGDQQTINEAQTNYISKDGNLYIAIADGKTVVDFFDMKIINDSDEMDFHFDMFDVGDKYGDPNRYKDESDEDEENE